MARITVEDCLQKVKNRFFLIHMASKRVRQLRKGVEPSIVTKNRDIVTALREIAAGNIVRAEKIDKNNLLEDKEEILSEEQKKETEKEALKDEKSEKIIPEGT